MRAKSNLDVIAHLRPLIRYARALTGNAVDAEDLVQEALLAAHAKRHTFRQGENLRAWLFAILHNRFISDHRRRQAETARNTALARSIPSQEPPRQDYAVELAQVKAAFHLLSAEHRAILHLIGVEGFSYPEAAEALDIPVGTVMSRLSRARAALRDTLLTIPETKKKPHLRIVGDDQ